MKENVCLLHKLQFGMLVRQLREGRSGGGQNIVRERGRIESTKIIFVSADRADGGKILSASFETK